MQRLGRLGVLLTAAASLGTFGVATLTGPASATPPISTCDHGSNGGGNLGDPGDGQNHHNESNGVGNGGDPGNAGAKASTCEDSP
jgi:hypothetical protein